MNGVGWKSEEQEQLDHWQSVLFSAYREAPISWQDTVGRKEETLGRN